MQIRIANWLVRHDRELGYGSLGPAFQRTSFVLFVHDLSDIKYDINQDRLHCKFSKYHPPPLPLVAFARREIRRCHE